MTVSSGGITSNQHQIQDVLIQSGFRYRLGQSLHHLLRVRIDSK